LRTETIDSRASRSGGLRSLPAAAGTIAVALIELLLCLSIFGPQPIGWIWVGSQVNFATDSLMTGLATAFMGSVVSICATVWIARRIEAAWVSRNRDAPWPGGRGLFETALVVATLLAVVGFVFWFLVIAGPGPTIAPNLS
jgi:hypothetical protein